MIIGIYLWLKHLNKTEEKGTQVEAKKMTLMQWIISIILTVIATIITGIILKQIGNAQPFTDATTNILAIFAQLLMIKDIENNGYGGLLLILFASRCGLLLEMRLWL